MSSEKSDYDVVVYWKVEDGVVASGLVRSGAVHLEDKKRSPISISNDQIVTLSPELEKVFCHVIFANDRIPLTIEDITRWERVIPGRVWGGRIK